MTKLLIVEDSSDNAMFLQDYMKTFFPTWEILTVGSGADAIETTLTSRPDIILLDIALSDEIDGIQVIKEIVKMKLAPRIILNTALGQKATKGPKPGRAWIDQLEPEEKALVARFFDKSTINWREFVTEIAKQGKVPIPEGVEHLDK